MCGFGGIILKNGSFGAGVQAELDDFDTHLAHRGPDACGRYVRERFSVTHQRLAIIDVANGAQPMFADQNNVGIAFNGEIYNFRELRSSLLASGFSFSTECDTEVVLALYISGGIQSLKKLDGMFSACIWDFRRRQGGEIFLIRDHIGTKPLYLYEDESRFAFSSELLPLAFNAQHQLEFNPTGIASYLTYRYCQAPYTLFRNVRRIEAGTYTRIADGKSSNWRYWDLPVCKTEFSMSTGEAAERLRYLLRKSVLQQQMSEVPIALLLSGGLDSTILAALCAEIGVN